MATHGLTRLRRSYWTYQGYKTVRYTVLPPTEGPIIPFVARLNQKEGTVGVSRRRRPDDKKGARPPLSYARSHNNRLPWRPDPFYGQRDDSCVCRPPSACLFFIFFVLNPLFYYFFKFYLFILDYRPQDYVVWTPIWRATL